MPELVSKVPVPRRDSSESARWKNMPTTGTDRPSICLICTGDERVDVRQQILLYLALGYTDEQIARRLSLSVRTVRRRIANVMEELNATSRFAAGVRAVQEGWICCRVE